jgi:hypothetical protein
LQFNSSKRAQSIYGIQNAANRSIFRQFNLLLRRLPTMFYPTPPPFSSHAHEKNKVTLKKPEMTCQNKELTYQPLSAIRHFGRP